MASHAPRKIGLSLGTHRSLQKDGLGEFGSQLGSLLARRAAELREVHGVELHFYVAKPLLGVFGDEVQHHAIHELQKFLHVGAEPFDVWHSFHQHNRILPPIRSRERILTIHDLNFFYFKSCGKVQRYSVRMQRMMRRFGHLVTISRYVEEDVKNRLGFGGDIRTIYNGARDLRGTEPCPVPSLEGRPFFFHLSRMSPSKNIEALLALSKAWPQMHFVFAGSRNADSMHHRAQAEGLANVSFLFDISDGEKAWLYEHCEGFLLPSLTEGFGLPPIEAMHFGKPVFLSDRTCLPEIGGDQAFYWHDFDPGRMREVLEAGLARYAAEGMGPGIQAQARRYSWDQCAEAYLKLYLSLLPARGL